MSDESKKRLGRRGGGSIFQKRQNWVVQYYRFNAETGKSERKREYTAQPKCAVAQRLLTERLAQINRGEQFEVGRRTTVGMLFDALRIYTENNNSGTRSVEGLMWRWKHLSPFFSHIPAANVTTEAIEKYKKQRRVEVAAKATINRELATLRRMFHYGKQSTPPTVHNLPHVRMFRKRTTCGKVSLNKLTSSAWPPKLRRKGSGCVH